MQFKLRTLMIAIAVAAAVAAVISPLFRQLSELTQTRLLLIFGSLAFTNLFSLAAIVLIDAEMRRATGDCFVCIRTGGQAARFMTAIWCLLATVNVAMLVREINYKTGKGCGLYDVLYDSYPPILMLTYWLPTALMNWRMSRLRFCTNGLASSAFFPKSKITDIRWKGNRLYLTFNRRFKMDYAIPSTDRAAVERALECWRLCDATVDQREYNVRRIGIMLAAVFAIPIALVVVRTLLPAPTRSPRVRTTTVAPARPSSATVPPNVINP